MLPSYMQGPPPAAGAAAKGRQGAAARVPLPAFGPQVPRPSSALCNAMPPPAGTGASHPLRPVALGHCMCPLTLLTLVPHLLSPPFMH